MTNRPTANVARGRKKKSMLQRALDHATKVSPPNQEVFVWIVAGYLGGFQAAQRDARKDKS